MPHLLKRYQQEGDDHFITFSCHGRRPYLASEEAKALFQTSLERTRLRYHFEVLGYVIMPENVHLLPSEPDTHPLSKAIAALKLSISNNPSLDLEAALLRLQRLRLQQTRREAEVHASKSVARGLVPAPEHWPWSSYRHFRFNEPGKVTIDQ